MSERIVSLPSNDAYRTNWERIFGTKQTNEKTTAGHDSVSDGVRTEDAKTTTNTDK